MNMKKYEIADELMEHMETVLEMFNVPYRMDKEGIWLPDDVTEEEFSELLDDSMCEQERMQRHCTVPVVTYRTMLCREKLEKVMAYYGQDDGDSGSYAFHITQRDQGQLDYGDEVDNWNYTRDWREKVGPTDFDMGNGIYAYFNEKVFSGLFYTSGDLYPFLKQVLVRDNISFQEEHIDMPSGVMHFFDTSMTREEHRIAVIDALCELQREESEDNLPVYSAWTLLDEGKRKRLMELNGTDQYHVLICDRERIKHCTTLEQLREYKTEKERELDEWYDEDYADNKDESIEDVERDTFGMNADDFGLRFRDRPWKYDSRFATSDVLYPYVQQVLDRDEITYTIETEQKRTDDKMRNYFVTNLTEKEHGIIINDALCEYQRARNGDEIPVYSIDTLKNEEKKTRLMRLNGTAEYHILESELCWNSSFFQTEKGKKLLPPE